MRHIGILGGSFNPVHLGHLFIGSTVAEALNLDRLLMIPCALSPLKLAMADILASDHDRLEMLRLSVAEHGVMEVSDIDIKRGGISYAIHTVKALRECYPGDRLSFIIGMDALCELNQWHQIDEMLSLCDVVTVARPGVERPDLVKRLNFPLEVQQKLSANIIQGRLCDVSSSDIRRRIAEGRSISYLVCPAVEAYIKKQGLYSRLIK